VPGSAYVDEAGNLIATEEFEPNRERWHFAQVLPSIPEKYQCLACAQVFQQYPGPAVACPRCGHMYAQVE
jgi:rubrerythrin